MGLKTYMSEHDTYVDMGVLGDQQVTVRFDYQPEERQTRDDPGCSETIDITEVTWCGVDIVSMMSKDTLAELEEEIVNLTDDGGV